MLILKFITKKEIVEKIIQEKELDQGLGKVVDLGEEEEAEEVEGVVDFEEEEVEVEGEAEEEDSNSNNGKNKITKNS